MIFIVVYLNKYRKTECETIGYSMYDRVTRKFIEKKKKFNNFVYISSLL